MRILHIGNGNEKHLGRRFYDVGRKLQHGLIRNHHNALFFSDRDVARKNGILGTKLKGEEAANRLLLKLAKNFQPELVLLGHADIITNDTLAEIRAILPSTRMAQFNVDPLFRPENHQAILARVPYMDASFITTGGEVLKRYAAKDHVVSYMPNPVDAALEHYRAHEVEAPKYDVFYAVRATTMQDAASNDRLVMPRYLREHVEGLNPSFHGFDDAPELFGVGFYEAIGASSMGLNLSHKQTTKGAVIQATDDEKYLYSSDRISQYLGNGLLTFTERGFALEEMFAEDEVVYFSDKEELADKVGYYRQHNAERMRIAAHGWRKAHQEHSAEKVAQYMVNVTCGTARAYEYGWDATLWSEAS